MAETMAETTNNPPPLSTVDFEDILKISTVMSSKKIPGRNGSGALEFSFRANVFFLLVVS